MTRGRVVVVGSMNRDYVCRVPSLPKPGETLLGGELTLGAGGKGGNQAVAVARLGGRCTMIGAVGDDPDGRYLRAALLSEGIDVEGVTTDSEAATGVAFVFVDPVGENSIVVAAGANATLTPQGTTDALQGMLTSIDVVVAQAEIPIDAVVAALRAAEAAGARAVLNLAPFQPVPDDVLGLCDPLIVNESEAKALLHLPPDRDVTGGALLDDLREVSRSVVVTLGAAGAMVAFADRVEVVAAESVDVVDSTGAGDAFTGAVAAALAAGVDLPAAVQRGVAAGTSAVQRPGAQASYPTAGDLLA